ncbi:MAG: CinA family protein [Candidatus Omnitrophica bacterium]|nr:CinA family protein [Candidatus Omnitrophota bacterium]
MKNVKKLVTSLKAKNLTLSLAESCSGGYLSYAITKVPGSSKVFKGSVVVYSLESKNIFLNLPKKLLDKSQGVSAEVAKQLAKSVQKKLKTSVGASIVGFAGPGGLEKKIGLVYICLTYKNKSYTKKLNLVGSRDKIRKKSCLVLAELINKIIS